MNIYSIKNTGVVGNIWKFIIILITNKRTYMTFFSIFLLTLPNTTAQTVGFITFLGQFFGFVFEVPSGYFSDKLGHKKALILGKFIIAISTLFFLLATSTVFFIIGAILMAFGQAMLSGTFSTFAKETLTVLGRGNQYSSIMGKVKSLGFAIPIMFIITLPILAENYGYQLAFFVVLLLDIIGFITTIFLSNISEKINVDEFNFKSIKKSFTEYLNVGWLPYVIFSSFVFALLFSATAGFKNPFQEQIGFSVSVLGILWACSRVGVSVLLLLNGWLKEHLNLKQVILLQGSVYSIVLIGVSLISNKWLIALLFIIVTAVMWGLGAIKSHFMLEYIENSNLKATFLSINNFFEKIITALLSLIMGYIVLNYSYQSGFLIFGLGVMVTTLVGLFVIKNKKTT